MKKTISLVIALILALSTTSVAFAENPPPTDAGTGTLEIGGTTFYVVAKPFTLETQSLNGSKVTMTEKKVDTAWEAVDPRGTGDGWHVMVSATDFVNTGDPSKTIAISGFKVILLNDNISTEDDTSSAKPVSDITTLTPLPTGIDPDKPIMLMHTVNVIQGDGMGSYLFSPEFQLMYPANTYAGTYESIVTVAIVTGPTV